MSPVVVPHKTHSHSCADLSDEPDVTLVFIYHAQKIFGFSPNVVFSGYLSECRDEGLVIVLRDSRGNVWRRIEQASIFAGVLEVRAIDASTIEREVERDIIGDFVKSWLTIQGYPKGYPVSIECEIDQAGAIEIKVSPCI